MDVRQQKGYQIAKTKQINELLLKILCHNIIVLIQEAEELGVSPDFIRSGA